jgi:hypothetical protein
MTNKAWIRKKTKEVSVILSVVIIVALIGSYFIITPHVVQGASVLKVKPSIEDRLNSVKPFKFTQVNDSYNQELGVIVDLNSTKAEKSIVAKNQIEISGNVTNVGKNIVKGPLILTVALVDTNNKTILAGYNALLPSESFSVTPGASWKFTVALNTMKDLEDNLNQVPSQAHHIVYVVG